MFKMGRYFYFNDYKEFEDYYYEKNNNEDISNLRYSTVKRIDEVDGDPKVVFDMDFNPVNTEPLYNFQPELVDSLDLDKGYEIIYDDVDNSLLCFKFYGKDNSLNILIGEDIGNKFFQLIAYIKNQRQ